MARLLPDTPLGTVSTEVSKFYRLLKQLPDDYTVWHRLSIWSEPGPDFWVMKDERVLLLKISTAKPKAARHASQSVLFQADSVRAFGSAEQDVLDQFVAKLGEGAQCFPTAIFFPNIAQADLDRLQHASAIWLGKDFFARDEFVKWLESKLDRSLTSELIERLRQSFTPEVVIPPHFTVRRPLERNTDAGLASYFLDYNQEWLLKSDLALSLEAQASVKDFNLRLINGVAGSGKSLIIVYRAHLLRRFYPQTRMLVLTHNKPLILDLESRYQRLAGKDDRGIDWQTFSGWCRKYWNKNENWPDPVSERSRVNLIERVHHEHLADTAVSARTFQDEIDWYKDRLLFSREDYLSADRSGRGFALNESMRHKIYDAMEDYHRDLHRRQHKMDWADVPRKLLRSLEQGKIKPPRYDVIMVDEAQFFAPIWFEIIKRLVKPRTGHLFLVADPTQGFLKRKQSWAAVGLDVRGRTHRLEKSYRTTREILNFATLLYRTRLANDDEDTVLNNPPNLLEMPNGTLPTLIPLTSQQDEVTRVVNEIRSLANQGIPLSHFLIICTEWQGVNIMLERLQKEFGAQSALDPKEPTSQTNHIRVCTLNAATGIESPIVFLCGVHDLYDAEQSVRLSDDERAELIRDNTRKLYMAVTRAGQRLVLTYVGDVPEWLRAGLNLAT
ncbi:MAG: DEAD/DEAH box helicase [Chloroflexi bacterium]|nr:DEAD/DEAH box helicase [Chloroflexota bacterium]